MPELAPEPVVLGGDGAVTDGGEGVSWGTFGTVTEGGLGRGTFTGGVVTVVTGVGTVTLGTVTVTEGGLGSVTALVLAAPASGATTIRPETAAEIQRIFRDMVSLTIAGDKTCANGAARLWDKSDPRTRYYRECGPVDRSLPSERASTRR